MITSYTSLVSFPGLGIDSFPVTRRAFSVFGVDVMWYGIIICFGIIAAFSYFAWRVGKEGVNFDSVLDYTLFTVPLAVLGARLYYVVFSEYTYDSFLDVINIRDGGLAIYGGIITGAVVVFCVAKYKKNSFLMIADQLAPGVMLAQSIGRWGNFTNVEAFGSETTLPWRMGVQRLGMTAMKYVHPTFLYESLWNLAGFILINIFIHKKKYHYRGQIFLLYICWYGFGRMFIEGLRSDSLYVGNSGIRVSQLIAFVGFAVSATLLFLFDKKRAALLKENLVDADVVLELPEFFGKNKKVERELASTGEVLYDTKEVERLDLIEENKAQRRVKTENPFETGKNTADGPGNEATPPHENLFEQMLIEEKPQTENAAEPSAPKEKTE